MKKIFIFLTILTLVFSAFLFFTPTTKADTSQVILNASSDSFVNNTNPGINYGNQPSMSNTYIVATGMEARCLIKFDLSSIPAGSTIHSANVSLYVITASGSPTPVIYYQRIIQDWGETTVNWNNKPSSAGNSEPFTIGNGINTTINFDITTMLKGWITGTPNNGFYLTHNTSTTFDRAFLTRETATPPKLTVSYSPPSAGTTTPPKSETSSSISEPENLKATLSANEKSVKLTWDASNSAKIDGYKIFRKEKGQDEDEYNKIGEVEKNVQEFEDKDAKAGKEYNYVARTYKDDKESENSNVVTIKIPQKSQNIQNQASKEQPWYKDWTYLLPLGTMFAVALGLLIYYLVTRKKNKNKIKVQNEKESK